EYDASILTADLEKSYASYGDVAFVTLSRFATEGNDLAMVNDKGKRMLELDDNEKAIFQSIKDSGKFNKTVVILNSVFALEMDWLEEYDVDAVLWVGNPGFYGMPGAVRVITGEVNPSGHTTATFAANSLSAPSAENFGLHKYDYGSNTPREAGENFVSYNEGIYVGYRYYETRYEDTILGQGNADSAAGAKASSDGWNYADEVCFPFGYGLSYTTYEYHMDNLAYDDGSDTFTATVTVSNTGDMDGKATVQLYAQSPYTEYDVMNGVEKASIQLMGYDKVEVAAGASETVEIQVPGYFLASYDRLGSKGYILDAGDYYFAVGNGAHDALNNVLAAKCGAEVEGKLVDEAGNVVTGSADAVAKWVPLNSEVDTTKYRQSRYNSEVEVTNTFDDADVNYWVNDNEKITYLSRSSWDTTYPTTLDKITVNDKLYDGLNMQTYVKAADAKSVDDFELEKKLDKKINFIDMKGVEIDDPKWDEFLSQLSLSELLINMGDSKGIKAVKAVNKPGCTIVDGPEGMNGQFKYGDRRNCTGWATLPIVGATWNHDVQMRFGQMYGEDALYASIPIAYAPGADTLRSPYSGRTSEYFSEDGVLSYYAAKNVSHGMRTKGLIGTVKHFFLNEQEAGRQGISTYANEQAIREIYMRAFEGSLAEGDSLGVMTAYNRIGVMYAAASQGIQHILRDEWGYGGYIIDDALTASAYSSAPEMLMAGNNIFCLDTARPTEIEKLIMDTDDGDLLEKVIESNKYMYYIMLKSSMGGADASEIVVSDAAPWWQILLRVLDVTVILLLAGAVVMYVLHTYTKVFSKETDVAATSQN
nr:glycoside hydrolase family 3 C-terminal domain-containing protein [Lachnospiraceae bacterium]